MAEQYPQYAGLTNKDLQAKLDANSKKMDAMEPGINAAKAKLRLAEQQKHDAVDKFRAERGYTTRELFDVSKKLRTNPNDPALLAEKARLKGLRDAYEAKIQPYREAEEKAFQDVRKASEGYSELWIENGDIDHKMRLATDPKAEWGDSDSVLGKPAETFETDSANAPSQISAQAGEATVDNSPFKPEQITSDEGGTIGPVADTNTAKEVRDSQEGKSTGGVQESTEGKGAGNVVNEESAKGSENTVPTNEEEQALAEELEKEGGVSSTDGLDDYAEDYNTEEVGKVSTDYPYDTDKKGSEDDDFTLGGSAGDFDDLDAFGGKGDDVNLDFNTDTPPELRRNVLNDFSSYTYHIELFILSAQDYNNVVDDPQWRIEEQSNRLLIKSGGGNYEKRNQYFALDYYIDNLKIDGVVAPRGQNIGSTNTEISFTITEPYGMTLLNSFVMACKSVGSYNYLDQPYMLKISFKGYDDQGRIANMDQSSMTRYIPIRFADFKFTANQNGTEYQIQAMPYHSIGLQNTKATIPTDIRIEATTVSDFFTREVTTVTNTVIEEKVKVDQRFRSAQGDGQGNAVMTTQRKDTIDENVQGGLAGYLNTLEKDHVAKGTKNIADEYKFEIDKDIGNSKILLQHLVELRKVKNEKDPRKVAMGQFLNNFQFDEKKQSFTIRAGIQMPNVIHSILRTSEYMINQVSLENLKNKDSLKYSEQQNKPIMFYRIVPRVRLKDLWDIKRNCYAKEITYVIKKYEMKGKDYENLGQAQISNIVKEYKYLYTGENTEILNFNIEFNAAYYQKNMYNLGEKGKGTATVKSAAMEDAFENTGNLAVTNPDGTTNITPIMKEVTAATGGSSDINNPLIDPKTLIVNSFMNDVFNTGADLVECDLEILGDPAYIQTYDIRHAVLASQAMPALDPETRALNPDREWHLTIEFRNPVDINEKTGLYEGFGVNKEGVAIVTAPTMSGIYKAVEVTSTFSNGIFKQMLKCIRERVQTASLASEKEQDPSKNVAANNKANEKLDKQGGQPDQTTIGKSTAPHLEGKHSGLSQAEQLLGDGTMTASSLGINTDDLVEEDVDYIGDADADTGNWQPKEGTVQQIGSETEEVAKETRSSLTGTTASNATQTVEKEKPLPTNVTADSVTGGFRAFNPATGKAKGFSTLAEAEAFASAPAPQTTTKYVTFDDARGRYRGFNPETGTFKLFDSEDDAKAFSEGFL